MIMKTRKEILLKAAYDIMKKCSDSYFVISPNEATAFYDGAECDGQCLLQDIAIELGIDDDK